MPGLAMRRLNESGKSSGGLASRFKMDDSQRIFTEYEMHEINDFSPADFNQLLVDLDGHFQEMSADIFQSQEFAKCDGFNEANRPIGKVPVHELELAKPWYIYIGDSGDILFRYRPVDNEGNFADFGYTSFNDMEGMFPHAEERLVAFLLLEYQANLTDVASACSRRFSGKHQMIALANEAINHGRRMRACNLLEEEGEAQRAFYEADQDFGQF